MNFEGKLCSDRNGTGILKKQTIASYAWEKNCQLFFQNESYQIGFWNIFQEIVSKLYFKTMCMLFPFH